MPLASLGVCYYPEHWPQTHWRQQAATMRSGGIQLVRIAEFAWSRIEPIREQLQWEWLDAAIETLAAESLEIIMCTPTACPPRWLVERYPDILPTDIEGRTRHFGSRRHYRFASGTYRREALRISKAVVDRYAAHPAVVGWQLDNEYGCHDTTLSFAEEDESVFQAWLAERYANIDALNAAWGTVFWSQEYRSFEDVGRPNLTVTEANPAHWLDYWRFGSQQVSSFNSEQRRLLRESAGADRWVTHNFMGNFTDFDHFEVAADLDVASWDSYPLGFLDQGWFSDEEKLRYRRIGHPDWAAFHHDLYRAVGRGRFAVMEQQPGPVNWAESNAEPVGNAPAFWGMEAIAHGAEFVSFFRYQQLPRAQEQMHAALRLPTGDAAPAWHPLLKLAADLKAIPDAHTRQAPIALLFDYPSCWAGAVQPHAPDMDTLQQAFTFYSAARQLGVDMDIVDSQATLDNYSLLIIPGTIILDDALIKRVTEADLCCLSGPRSGSRDERGALPTELAPGPLQSLLPLRVIAVDSMRRGARREFSFSGETFAATRWFESLDTELEPRIRCDDGAGLWYSHLGHHYLNANLPTDFLCLVIKEILKERKVATLSQPEGLRIRRRGDLCFAFNFSNEKRCFDLAGAERLCGEVNLLQGEYAAWRVLDRG